MRAVLLGAFVLLVMAPTAGAHAVLTAGDPLPSGHVDAGLSRLELRFSEPVERLHTSADVVDTQGWTFSARPPAVDAEDPRVVHLPLRPLENGTYAATWRTLSVDGHTARGAYVFTVGSATLPVVPAPEAYDPSIAAPHQLAQPAFIQAAHHAGLLVALGLAASALLLVRPERVPPALLGTAAAFAAVGALASGIALWQFAADVLRPPMQVATATTAGRLLSARGALLGVAALGAVAGAAAPMRLRRGAAAMTAVAAGGALVMTAAAHATPLMRVLEAVQLLAGAFWLGALATLLLAPDADAALTRRARTTAAASAGALVVGAAGALAASAPCPTCVDALVRAPYAPLALVRVLVLAALSVVAALALRLRVAPDAARRLARGEVAGLALAIVLAGLVAVAPPPAAALEAGEQPPPAPLSFEATTNTSRLVLEVHPNPPASDAPQRVTVVVHPLGDRLPNGTRVLLELTPPDADAPQPARELPRVTPDTWEDEGAFLTEPGAWRVAVVLDQPDERARLEWTLRVPDPAD